VQTYQVQVQAIARNLGLDLSSDRKCIDHVMPILERMRMDGSVVVIKLSGRPQAKPYTTIITGGALGEDFIQMSAATVEEATGRAIVNYARRFWQFTQ